MSIGYVTGRRDESISVAAGALREATTSAQGWALVGSQGGQPVPVAGSRVVLRVDQAARARTPVAVTDGRDAFSILAQAATADARRREGWDAERVVAVSDLVGTVLAATARTGIIPHQSTPSLRRIPKRSSTTRASLRWPL